MRARIIRVGNSHGIRIPKPLLQQSGLSGDVEIGVKNGSLIIRSTRRPRSGWAEAFQAMAEAGDDRLLDAQTSTRWDQEEWEWR